MNTEAQATLEGACAVAAHDGTPIKIDGKWWVFPPLTIKQVRRLAPNLTKLGAGLSLKTIAEFDGAIAPVVETLHAAIQRNYPDLTLDAFEEMLDLDAMQKASIALFQISGFVKSGEAAAGSKSQ